MRKVINQIYIVSVLFVILIMNATLVQASAGFTFSLQEYISSSPDVLTLTQIQSGVSTKYYTNFSNDLYVNWAVTSGLNVVLQPVGVGSAVNIKTGVTGNVVLKESDLTGNGISEGEYYIYLVTTDSVTSASGVLRYDKTAPAVPTGQGIEDANGNHLQGTVSRLRTVTLTWNEPADSDPLKYNLYYRVGNASLTLLETTAEGDTSEEVTLPTAVADGVITFEIKSVDKAGNESTTSATVSYTLDSVNPNPASNVSLRNSNNEVLGSAAGDIDTIWFTSSTSNDVAYYLVKVKKGSAVPVELTSGVGTLLEGLRYIDISGESYTSGDLLVFEVITYDTAGNASTGVTVSSTYDGTAPIFNITKNINTTVSGITVIAREVPTLFVTNTLGDISSYAIRKDAGPITFKSGNAAALTTDLRALGANGAYTVIVRDLALNRSEMAFTLEVEPPVLPGGSSNRIRVSADPKDTRLSAGISKTGIQVQFTASNGATDYELYLDGQKVTTSSGVSGTTVTLTFELKTIPFGDQQFIIQVRAVDANGNFSTYDSLLHTFRDLSHPLAIIHSTNSDSTTIDFDVEVLDYMNSINLNYLEAWLYLDDVFLKKMDVVQGRNTYTFDGLRVRETDYSIRIVATYTLDGVNYTDRMINAPTNYAIDTTTSSEDILASIRNLNVGSTTVSFDVLSTKATTSTRSYNVVMYSGLASGVSTLTGNPFFSKSISLETTNLNVTTPINITGLSAGENYHIQIKDGSLVIATASFYTNKDIPETTLSVTTVTQNTVSVVATIIDPDGAITRSDGKAVIRIFDEDGELVTLTDLKLSNVGSNPYVITDLSSDTKYTLKIYTNYEAFIQFPNGLTESIPVNNALIGTYIVSTAKRLPTAEFSQLEAIENKVDFRLFIEDVDVTLRSSEVYLYQNGVVVGGPIAVNRGTFNLAFDNLKSNTEYVISLHVQYDLNDGLGVITKQGFLTPSVLTNSFVIQSFATTKVAPDFIFVENSLSRTNTSLTISLRPVDPDNTFKAGLVKIFTLTQSAPLTQMFTLTRVGDQTFTFTNLDPDTQYRIVVDAEYDLADGRLQRSAIVYEERFRTRTPIAAQIISLDRETTSIDVSIEMFDYTSQDVFAKLFQGTTPVGLARRLVNGVNELTFSNLQPNTDYKLVIDYNAGQSELTNQPFRTLSIDTKNPPSIVISNATVSGVLANIQVTVSDPDSALTTNAQLTICAAGDECVVITRSITQLRDGTGVDLPFESQTISLQFTYNDNTELKTITLQTTILEVSEDVPEATQPIPTPAPNPETPAPNPETPEPGLGRLLLILVSVGVVGFIGVFIYSFRSVYLR